MVHNLEQYHEAVFLVLYTKGRQKRNEQGVFPSEPHRSPSMSKYPPVRTHPLIVYSFNIKAKLWVHFKQSVNSSRGMPVSIHSPLFFIELFSCAPFFDILSNSPPSRIRLLCCLIPAPPGIYCLSIAPPPGMI